MSTFGLIEYQDASPQVRAVYDDIMATRGTDWINNFWKAIAHDPALLERTWESIKQTMAPGASYSSVVSAKAGWVLQVTSKPSRFRASLRRLEK